MTAIEPRPAPSPIAFGPTTLPDDYLERVYAGVLGKIIGVYLGRPFENWSYEKIAAELGDIDYYVHERLGKPLVVTDDDISGTFTFIRALPDHGNTPDLTPAQIGQTWLNYLIEGRTVLWWGGMGASTEHTAYLRLKGGIPAPRSGSAELNTRVVAEQIGAQIFIDGWAMVAPGNPALAADLARRAASVSHDGEAIYGAQVVAAMEAAAFVEPDLQNLIDTALGFIPADAAIARMIADLRRWRQEEPDWRKARERLAANYGYDKFGGGCHMVPNHGLILLALLYGDDDFQKSLKIVNTCGWDTDCNAGNVGCILGIKNGLAGIDAGPDFRTPVRDRILLPTADGGRCITDAVQEAQRLVAIGHAMAGEEPVAPKDGARFHFDLPGALQGFACEDSPESRGTARLENREGHSRLGSRNLTLHLAGLATGRIARVATPTFVTPEQLEMKGYGVAACPTLYPGQTVTAEAQACSKNPHPLEARLYVRVYGKDNTLVRHHGSAATLEPGQRLTLDYRVPALHGSPVAEVGIELASSRPFTGRVYLDSLTWAGTPNVAFDRPADAGGAWDRAWVNAADEAGWSGSDIRLISNRERRYLIQGTRDWAGYAFSARVRPHMADAAGIAACVQGLERYYALLLKRGGRVELVKRFDGETTLASADFAWRFDEWYDLTLETDGDRVHGSINGQRLIDVTDGDRPLRSGAVGLVNEIGRSHFAGVRVRPL